MAQQSRGVPHQGQHATCSKTQQSCPHDDPAAMLIARLSSQFGDLDLELLNQSLQGVELPKENGDEQFPREKNGDSGGVPSSEESSLADPTPEELAAWQAQQFQQGKEVLQRQKEESMDPIQKRRLALRRDTKQEIPINEGSVDDYDEDWEEIASLPDLQGQSSIFFATESSTNNLDSDDNFEDGVVVGVSPLLTVLATSPKGDPELLGTAWHRLYSSAEGDGLSFFNLCHEIFGFEGPTLLLLQVVPSQSKRIATKGAAADKTTTTIGFFTTTTWRESSEYHGSYSNHDKSFLFAMDTQENKFEIFEMQRLTNGKNANQGCMYCHPSTKSTNRRRNMNFTNDRSDTRTDGSVHGIGIGGNPSQPRLHLTESLEECRGLTYDSSRSFKDGNLFLNKSSFEDSLYYFDVESIEVWGVGGITWIRDALEAREKARGIAASNLQQRRRIYDKTQLLEDFRHGIHSTTTKTASNGSYFDHVSYAPDRCDV